MAVLAERVPMSHACEDCGETFDTLSALRLHECPAPAADDGFDVDGWMARRGEERRKRRRRLARQSVGTALDEPLERARSGEANAAVSLLAHFERELDSALERDDHGDTYRAVFWTYLEPVCRAVDRVAREAGWPLLLDVIDAYDPRSNNAIPHAGAVVTNAVARGVVRTRLTDGVEAVPLPALTFLASIPRLDDGSAEVAWEESSHYGWAVDHPDAPFEATVLELVAEDPVWAGQTATQALFTDQHAGVDLYGEVLRRMSGRDRSVIAPGLSRLEGQPNDERFPRYWDVDAEFDRDFTFAFAPSVNAKLRETVEALELADALGNDWTFADLEIRW